MSPYQKLANAIVLLAAQDYRETLEILCQQPRNQKYIRTRAELEDFFLSDWFQLLTSLNGSVLMEDIQREVIRKAVVA